MVIRRGEVSWTAFGEPRLGAVSTGDDTVTLRAFQDSADEGWADVASGRFTDVADDDLEEFPNELGAWASTHRQ